VLVVFTLYCLRGASSCKEGKYGFDGRGGGSLVLVLFSVKITWQSLLLMSVNVTCDVSVSVEKELSIGALEL
jgi:hypothetical protein